MAKGNKQNFDGTIRSAEVLLGPRDDFRVIFRETQSFSHGLTVRPEGRLAPIFQDIHDEHSLAQAILTCFEASPTGRVILTTQP